MGRLLLCIVLPVVAGWVDTSVFFAIGLFSAHVTGNIVLVFATLRQPGASVLLGALSVPVFIAVAWLAALIGQVLDPRAPAHHPHPVRHRGGAARALPRGGG